MEREAEAIRRKINVFIKPVFVKSLEKKTNPIVPKLSRTGSELQSLLCDQDQKNCGIVCRFLVSVKFYAMIPVFKSQ